MGGVRRASRIVGVSVLGTLLLVAGAVMLVTPGPGLLLVAAGLAILAREFRWARRLLALVRRRLAGRSPRWRRRRATVTELDDPPPQGGGRPLADDRRDVA